MQQFRADCVIDCRVSLTGMLGIAPAMDATVEREDDAGIGTHDFGAFIPDSEIERMFRLGGADAGLRG